MWNIRKFVKTGKYVYAVVPEHPRAIEHGYVLAHRVIAENAINRLLTEDEIVHHINGNSLNNVLENLEILTAEEHGRLHAKDRWQRRLPAEIKHGTTTAYRYHKCRCELCRKANTESLREYRKIHASKFSKSA
jgi:hypothetical protein